MERRGKSKPKPPRRLEVRARGDCARRRRERVGLVVVEGIECEDGGEEGRGRATHRGFVKRATGKARVYPFTDDFF